MIEGLQVTALGMTTVFALLGLMVVAMQLAARFFHRYAHLFPEEAAPAPRTGPYAPDESGAAVAIAIAAARAAHRSQKGEG